MMLLYKYLLNKSKYFFSLVRFALLQFWFCKDLGFSTYKN